MFIFLNMKNIKSLLEVKNYFRVNNVRKLLTLIGLLVLSNLFSKLILAV